MKRKIVLYVDQLGGGGAERVASVLINKLCGKDFEKILLILEKTEREYVVADSVPRYYVIDASEKISGLRIENWYRRVLKVRGILGNVRPDIVLSLAKPSTNLYLILAQLGMRLRLLLSERSAPQYYPRKYLMRKIRDFTYYYADGVIFQSEVARGVFSRTIQKKGAVIPNPLLPDLPEAKQSDNKTIITVCRLSEEKNLFLLIDGFLLFSRKHPEYRLLICGDGPLRETLECYAERLGMKEKVCFCGFIRNVHSKIAESEVFVLNSRFEGLSNSMIEAMAIGVPVVCTDCPVGTARVYIESRVNGILIPVGDTDALFHALCDIAEDEALRKRLGSEAKKIRERLSERKIMGEWERYLLKGEYPHKGAGK